VSNEIWVINASPLILLGKLGRTDLLESLALQVIVPQAVFREVAAGAAGDTAMKVALDWAASRVQDDILVPPSVSGWDLGAMSPRTEQPLADTLPNVCGKSCRG
jgi:hypothetical protein